MRPDVKVKLTLTPKWYLTLCNPKLHPLSDSGMYTLIVYKIIGPRREKTCLRGFANNTGADQPVHPRSLISAFVIRLLESIVSRHATSEISNF